jgi:hypothetical protein
MARPTSTTASTSGSVALRFTPASSLRIGATSLSGDVSASRLQLTGQVSGPHSLWATLGLGGPTISVRTTSGSFPLAKSF